MGEIEEVKNMVRVCPLVPVPLHALRVPTKGYLLQLETDQSSSSAHTVTYLQHTPAH